MPLFSSRPSFLRRAERAAPPRATGDDASLPPSTLYADLQVVSPGVASPLGPSKVEGGGGDGAGVNFALWSSAATSVSLCLLDPRSRRPCREISLSRTEADPDVWAATVAGLPLAGVGYAFRVDGPSKDDGSRGRWSPGTLLLDPYAPLVDSRSRFGVRDAREAFVPLVGSSFVGTFDFEAPEFDWGEFFLLRFNVAFQKTKTNAHSFSPLAPSFSTSILPLLDDSSPRIRRRRQREVDRDASREARDLRGRRPSLHRRRRL